MENTLTVFSQMPEEHRYNKTHMNKVADMVSKTYLQIFQERAPRQRMKYIDQGKKKTVTLRCYPDEFLPIIKNCVDSYFKDLNKIKK